VFHNSSVNRKYDKFNSKNDSLMFIYFNLIIFFVFP
jgi:hypothetical protein